MLTAQEFVEAPDSCPSCGDRTSVDVDNDDEGFCHECRFEWNVERRFVGYSYEDKDGRHEVEIPDFTDPLLEQVKLLREAAAKVLDTNCGDPWALLDDDDPLRGGFDALKAALEATKEA